MNGKLYTLQYHDRKFQYTHKSMKSIFEAIITDPFFALKTLLEFPCVSKRTCTGSFLVPLSELHSIAQKHSGAVGARSKLCGIHPHMTPVSDRARCGAGWLAIICNNTDVRGYQIWLAIDNVCFASCWYLLCILHWSVHWS